MDDAASRVSPRNMNRPPNQGLHQTRPRSHVGRALAGEARRCADMMRSRGKLALVCVAVSLGLLAPDAMVPKAEPADSPVGALSVELEPGAGEEPFGSSQPTPLRSAYAKGWEPGDGCCIFTLCLSSREDVSCETAKNVEMDGDSFALLVGLAVAPGETLRPGEYENLGVILVRSGDKYFNHGCLGNVSLREVDGKIAGSVLLKDDRLSVSGDFIAELEPETQTLSCRKGGEGAAQQEVSPAEARKEDAQ